jgi:hypothetical protein
MQDPILSAQCRDRDVMYSLITGKIVSKADIFKLSVTANWISAHGSPFWIWDSIIFREAPALSRIWPLITLGKA